MGNARWSQTAIASRYKCNDARYYIQTAGEATLVLEKEATCLWNKTWDSTVDQYECICKAT